MKRSLVIGAALIMTALVLAGCENPGTGGGRSATCTVSFDADGGTFSGGETTQSLTVNRGASVGDANMPTATKDGYNFGGWYTEQNGSGTQFTASTPVTDKITVYAYWTVVVQSSVRHTVTFNADGGSPATQTRTVNSGASVGSLPIPARTRYTFGGWYTVQNGGGTQFTASTIVSATITVYAKWTAIQYKVSLDAVRVYLATASGGTTVNNPVALPVALNLASDWTGLLDAIKTAGKYVALDLSACTMSGMTGTAGEFNPGAANTGENKIVSLVLPDAATSIKAGSSDYTNSSTFKAFTALKSVSGSGIDTVGMVAFFGCEALTTVSLPKATDIGEAAFSGCAALTTVSLPAARSIGESAFSGCAALTTVSLPAATSIGRTAFTRCYALTTVSLPAAMSIGNQVFSGCAALTTVSLPAAMSIGYSAFFGCAALTTVSLPKVTDIGEAAFMACNALITVSLPVAMSIGNQAFAGCAALTTASLGRTAPTLGSGMFYGISAAKTVTVKVPSGATDYGTIPATYTGSTANWGNGFRGGGWNGSAFVESRDINSNITLNIQYGP